MAAAYSSGRKDVSESRRALDQLDLALRNLRQATLRFGVPDLRHGPRARASARGGFVYNGLSVIILFYTLYTVYMARQMYFTARNMLALRNDKSGLIPALEGAMAESDRARYRAEAASRSKFAIPRQHES
jgi:hypothetical protein